jgi:hypothetical protein
MWWLETSRVELQNDKGIYKIMYRNSRAYLQRSQVGLDLKNLIDLGGFCKICKTQKQIYNLLGRAGG